MFSNQARGILSGLSLLLMVLRADAADTQQLPTWSKHFSKVSDPDVRNILESYRKRGWLRVFLDKGEHLSGRELTASGQIARSELVKAIARDEEYLRRAGVSYATSRPSPSDCATAVRGVVAAVCDEQHRSSELSAIEGMLELLPAYSARLPAPPKSVHYGPVTGGELARVQVLIGSASRPPRKIDVQAGSKTVQAEVGDTLVVHLSMSDKTVVSGVSVTPGFDVLQLPAGTRRGATRLYFPTKAVGAGTATLKFFGPLQQTASATCSVNLLGGTSNCWSGYVVPGGPFGFMSGSWAVPFVAAGTGGESSHWIGIDGYGTEDLIQTGTEADYNTGSFLGIGAGTSYYAWFELVPQTQCGFLFITSNCHSDIGYKVFPGDQMYASITSVGPPLPGSNAPWRLVLQDLAPDNQWTFTTTQSFEAGQLATAEWILEASTVCILSCDVQALPDFYPNVTFDSFNGKLQELGFDLAGATNPAFTAYEALSMNNPPAQFATPSAPDSDQDGFTVILGPAGLPPPPLLLTSALPNAAVGSAYSHDLVASGEVWGLPVVWTLPGATGLPPGLQFANGTISGTPQAAGTFAITFYAMETANYSATMVQSVSLTVLSAWPGPPNFAVQLPPAIGLAGGGNTGGLPKPCSGDATFLITPTNGFSGAVQFSVPADSYRTITFVPNPVQIGEVTTSTTAMSIRYEHCPAVSVNLDITATSGAISHSFIVPVKPPPPTCGTSGRPPCP
jgi:hypothetical protein